MVRHGQTLSKSLQQRGLPSSFELSEENIINMQFNNKLSKKGIILDTLANTEHDDKYNRVPQIGTAQLCKTVGIFFPFSFFLKHHEDQNEKIVLLDKTQFDFVFLRYLREEYGEEGISLVDPK